MSPHQPNSPTRTRIVLEGGGRLEDVAQIVEIRLNPEPVEWTRVEADTLEVRGAINAYFYCLRSKGRGVEGQGFRIPYSRRVPVPMELPLEGLEVHLENLESNHDFNPISGDFQHKVSAFVVLQGAGIQAVSKTGGAPPANQPSETRLSQVRDYDRAGSQEAAEGAPMATRPPSPEEFESMRQAVESRANSQRGVESRLPHASTHDGKPEPEPVKEEVPESAPQPSTAKAAPQEEAPPQERKERNETLVWKPFPPPIA